MKKIIPFLIPIFIFSCTNEKETPTKTEEIITAAKFDTLNIGAKTYFIQDLADTNYAFSNFVMPRDTDDKAIKKMEGLVKRENDSLFLKCDDGNIIKLVNHKSQDDEYRLFNFIDLNSDINYYVISCLKVESMNYLLVNKQNGKPIETFGYPYASPNKNYFVCGNCDLVAAFDVNGISIYEKNKTNYRLLGTRELTDWGPVQMFWKNDTTLFIKGNRLKADKTTLETMHKVLFIK